MNSHINKNNNPTMVDISKKNSTIRFAKAEGSISFDKTIFKKIQNLQTKKGNLENIAILAGILGAKETSRIIPLCHNIPINSVNIEIKKNIKKHCLNVIAEVKTNAMTGVEMEALVAVSISCLTIYDMCKFLSKKIEIKNIKLISKSGGKSDFKR
tara:strand:- start:514 stop:978 length:465 start_codon:yes stop_codon:yes gene_type:complete